VIDENGMEDRMTKPTACLLSVIALAITIGTYAQSPSRSVQVKSADGAVVGMTKKSIKLKNGETVEDKLKESGVSPTSDSVSLIYDWNPQIGDFHDIKPGETITIPAVSDANRITPASMFVDSDVKSRLSQRASTLQNTSTQTREVRAASSEFGDTAKALQTYPASGEMLIQVDTEGQLLDAYSKKTVLTEEDKIRIGHIAADLRLKRDAAHTEKADPLVEVRTVMKGSGKEVGDYTVFFSAVELYQLVRDRSFPQPSSPTKQRLPVANYYIWAAKAGDPSPVSDRKRVEVRVSDSPVPVVLTVLK
jgi:hypothetical protein